MDIFYRKNFKKYDIRNIDHSISNPAGAHPVPKWIRFFNQCPIWI